ncbi:outer membrane beta-barrel protein [Myroides pelagicus]|uniref:outer membrane beta-barrel protein n=1 Tax=Myroides pelagicus TaxID=270914 RepID=UPI002DB9445C|nr:outer membrane beta-barrel protein [Myroides pelagicus]MEC4115296.1 outer membrane beta-barrel protein [Myroides pelagicus]
MKRKEIKILLLVSLCCATSFAQEVHVSVSSFFNKSSSSIQAINTRARLGYEVGAGYRYYFSQQWSIGAAVAYQHKELDFINRGANGNWSSTDIEGDIYDFRYKTKNSKEYLTYNSVNIPLTLQYETRGVVKWYLQTGVGLSLSLGTSQSEVEMNNLHTSGYYPKWDAELTGPSFMGFGYQHRLSQKNNIKIENRYSWLFETGIIQELGNKQSLYIGAFIDLGLNNLIKKENREANPISISSNLDSPVVLHSIWRQEKYKSQELKDYHLGFKLKYAFAL